MCDSYDELLFIPNANQWETGAIDLAAFIAGNDVLLMSEDVTIGTNSVGSICLFLSIYKSAFTFIS